MAGDFSTPNPRAQPSKQMSSRLLNMKVRSHDAPVTGGVSSSTVTTSCLLTDQTQFMQRATASTPPNQRGGMQTPSTEPAFKRRKINDTSAASSPSVSSTPGTPYAADTKYTQQTPTTLPEILRRGGTSTFTRGDGADTEWVLDLKMTPRQSKPVNGTNGNTNGPSGIPGLGEVESDKDEDDDDDDDDEDIWHNQPAGRQTYGSFKRKGQAGGKPKKAKDNDADEDDEDLSSASNSLSDSSDGDSDSDKDNDPSTSSDEDNDKNTYARQRRLQQKLKRKQSEGSTGGGRKGKKGTTTAAEDSDEEMRRVRLAMEQKHDRMAGIGGGGGLHGTPRGGGGGGNVGRGGTKRPRRPDDHHGYNTNYKERPRSKKARKTI